MCWIISHQLAACLLSCPVLRCIPYSFLLMKANCKSMSDLRFLLSYLKYPSHVWRRFPSSAGVLIIVCPIVSLFVLSSYFLLSQYVLPFPVALLRMIAILVHLVMGVCNYVERFFILLLSVFLRVEGVMDCQSVASAEIYNRSCILSFLRRSSSNWVMGCLLWLWRCTYRCLFVTVWRSGARYCESVILRNCKSASLVCEICCRKIQYCAWFGLEDVSLAYWKYVTMAASPVVFQLLCNTL